MKNQFENIRSVSLKKLKQITTRDDGVLEKGEFFNKEDIDFSRASHLKIHQSGEIAGSQFNNKIFSTPEEVISFVKKNLPERLQYDQFNRCEITIELSISDNEPIGWSGVKSIDEIKKDYPQIKIIKQARMPGGIPAEKNGILGTWYPEMVKTENGDYVIAKNELGEVLNAQAKFEPLANIAMIPKDSFAESLKTDKLTVIIQEDREKNIPIVITMFPGENAPAFPAMINTENYKRNSMTPDSMEAKYWEEHAFLQLLDY
jgi:hypothetical protein